MIRHFYLLNDSSKSIHHFLREFQIIYMILIKKLQFFFGCCDRIVWPENAQEQRHIYQSLKSFIRFCAVVFFFDSVSFAQNSFRVYSTYALELDYLMCNLLYLLYVRSVHTDTHTAATICRYSWFVQMSREEEVEKSELLRFFSSINSIGFCVYMSVNWWHFRVFFRNSSSSSTKYIFFARWSNKQMNPTFILATHNSVRVPHTK